MRRSRRNRSNLLFSGVSFHDYKRKVIAEMEEEISSLSSNQMKNSTDALVLIFKEKYGLSELVLHEPEKEDGGEVEIDVSGDPRRGISRRRGPVHKTAKRIQVKLPYEGPADLLDVQPTTFDLNPPQVERTTGRHIEFNVDFFPKEVGASEVQREIDKKIEKIEKYFVNLNDDIETLNRALEDKARRAIARRRDEVEAAEEVMDALDVDRSGREGRGFVKPEKKREIEIPAPSSGDGGPVTLPGKTFVNLLDILDDVGKNLERSAPSVRELGEEPFRDILLAAINSHYAGLATGETFQSEGRTDIYLRYNNEPLFVAECKVWAGKERYGRAVDQLLEYLTVRDSHAAILVFSDRQDFQRVEDLAEEATLEHDQYQKDLSRFEDHRVFKFDQESGKEVELALKVFDLST